MRKGRPRFSKFPWRNAPLPSFIKTAKWGYCRWCGKRIYQEGTRKINKRRHWHKECQHYYWIVTDFRYAKRAVKKRDKGICSKCGKYCHYRWEWDLDHIVPLVDAPRELKYWTLDNLQSLCVECHHKKTIKENAERKKHKMDKRKNYKRNRKNCY